ncbi:HAD-IA family hydrolase [Dehalobacter sp. DCM]|uniref:HAD family hydrolase n=1 Tax=Dehalobacter sp. DCM TaxID=2907827 RepID=UPI0030817C0F|nr:HAD-IA family hydrolase [Dehalobacter sp. DCM]
MDYEAILFDFDYTLGDSTQAIWTSINYALSQLGYGSRDVESVRRTIGLSLKETFFQLTQKTHEEECNQFIRLFREKADQVVTENTEFLPYALNTLEHLKANSIKTGIVTTKFHYRIDQILDKFGAASLIDIIVGSDDVQVVKPDPEGLLYAINILNIPKEKNLYVGDSIVDARTAQNAGVSFIGVTTGTATKDDLMQFPHVKIITDLSEFMWWQ